MSVVWTTLATIEDVEEVFEWDDVFGKKIPKPTNASKVVYVKSEWYVSLKNFIRMDAVEFDKRTFWNAQFIWMTELEYAGIKFSVPRYDESQKSYFGGWWFNT